MVVIVISYMYWCKVSTLKDNHRGKEKEFKEKSDKFEEEYNRKKINWKETTKNFRPTI